MTPSNDGLAPAADAADARLSDIEADDEGVSISEPFDPGKIRIQLWQPTIELLMKRVREGEIDLMPDFQRKAGLWKQGPKSRLIESILVKIPLPAFYMDNTKEDCLVVVDGLQRLTALREFIVDQTLDLQGLEFLVDLRGKHFHELPRAFRRRIEETQVAVFLIEKGTPEEVKFNIFKRINTGGLPLSSQEIRHALNKGPGRDFLRQVAGSKEFREATGGGVPDERMADREMVLRFVAFVGTPAERYSPRDFDLFLTNAFKNLNEMDDSEREFLRVRILRALVNARLLFGDRAFRKWYRVREGRKPINKALFEAWMVNLNMLDNWQLEVLRKSPTGLQERFRALMADPAFDRAVSQGTADAKKIQLRFSSIRRCIMESLDSLPEAGTARPG